MLSALKQLRMPSSPSLLVSTCVGSVNGLPEVDSYLCNERVYEYIEGERAA